MWKSSRASKCVAITTTTRFTPTNNSRSSKSRDHDSMITKNKITIVRKFERPLACALVDLGVGDQESGVFRRN